MFSLSFVLASVGLLPLAAGALTSDRELLERWWNADPRSCLVLSICVVIAISVPVFAQGFIADGRFAVIYVGNVIGGALTGLFVAGAAAVFQWMFWGDAGTSPAFASLAFERSLQRF